MDNTQQPKNGFKTFLITVSISLIVFSAIYLFLTDSADEEGIESEIAQAPVETQQEPAATEKPEVQGTADTPPVQEEPKDVTADTVNAFGALAEEEIEEEGQVVETEEPSTTTPTETPTQETIPNEQNEVLGTSDTSTEPEPTKPAEPVKTEEPEVLASASTTPIGGLTEPEVLAESTPAVPTTGTSEVTYALLLGFVALGVGGYFLLSNPNKVALQKFEDSVKKKL